MAKARLRFLTTDEALTALELAKEFHTGKRPLPPEIVAKRKEIEAKIRNAELFLVRLRVVDEGMVNDIVDLKLQLDGLYTAWIVSETPRRTYH